MSNNSENVVTGISPFWAKDPLLCAVVPVIRGSPLLHHVSSFSSLVEATVMPSTTVLAVIVSRQLAGRRPRLAPSCGIRTSVGFLRRSATRRRVPTTTADVPRPVASTPHDPVSTSRRATTTLSTSTQPPPRLEPLRSDWFHVMDIWLFHATVTRSTA